MVPTRAFLVLTLVAALAGCAGGDPAPPAAAPDATEASGVASDVPEEALQAARDAAEELTSALKRTLGAELAASGVAGAVTVCAEVAQDIALEHTTDAVRVRRVSLRTRNPLNRPDAWEQDRLERMEAAAGDDEVVEVVAGDRGRALRYLKPIRVGAVCLQCHGATDAIDPEVLARIRETYPEDRAVGYATGDFRGAVSVTVWLDS